MNREEIVQVMLAVPCSPCGSCRRCSGISDGPCLQGEPKWDEIADAVLQHLASQRQEQGSDAMKILREAFPGTLADSTINSAIHRIRAQAAAQGATIEDAHVVCDKLAFQLADQKALVARLGAYALHKFACSTMRKLEHCDCGLDAILAEIAPTTPTP